MFWGFFAQIFLEEIRLISHKLLEENILFEGVERLEVSFGEGNEFDVLRRENKLS